MAVVFFIALVILTVVWVEGGLLFSLSLLHFPYFPHFPHWFTGAVALGCLAWFIQD